MQRDPIRAYVEELTEKTSVIKDPLVYPLVSGSADEWSNIPQLVARYCIHTQAHLNAVVSYLQEKSKDETSANLRAFTEKQLQMADETFQAYKAGSTDRIDELFVLDEENKQYEKQIDKDFIAFKNYCDAFKNEKVADLFQLKEEDMHYLKNDNLEPENNEEFAKDELTFVLGWESKKLDKFRERGER